MTKKEQLAKLIAELTDEQAAAVFDGIGDIAEAKEAPNAQPNPNPADKPPDALASAASTTVEPQAEQGAAEPQAKQGVPEPQAEPNAGVQGLEALLKSLSDRLDKLERTPRPADETQQTRLDKLARRLTDD